MAIGLQVIVPLSRNAVFTPIMSRPQSLQLEIRFWANLRSSGTFSTLSGTDISLVATSSTAFANIADARSRFGYHQ